MHLRAFGVRQQAELETEGLAYLPIRTEEDGERNETWLPVLHYLYLPANLLDHGLLGTARHNPKQPQYGLDSR